MNKLLRIMAVLALALVAGMAPARAHAVLLEASPADGAVLRLAPREITLRFNESVTPVFVRVLDAAGRAIDLPAPAQAVDETIRLTLPPRLADGSYVVSYRVISADTHPVGASLLFAVGPPGTVVGATVAPVASDGLWKVLALGDRSVLDLSFLVAIGGGLFAVLAGGNLRRPARVALLVPAALAAAAAISSLGIEGGLAAEAPLAALAGPGLWVSGFATGLGASTVVTLAGLGIFALGFARAGAPRRGAILLGAAVAAAGYALSGHVATAQPRWLTAPALWLHVLAVAFWAGSLVPLFRLLRTHEPGVVSVVERFGRTAVGVVALIVLAGTAMAAVQLTRMADFVATDYGARLAVKLALVVVLLAVAAGNRLALTPALRRGLSWAAPWLRRSIALELALIAGIVVMAVSLGQATPPRALAEQERSPPAGAPPGYFVAVAELGLNAYIALEPAKPGLNRLRLDLTDEGDAPFAARELTLSIANAALGIEPSEHTLRAAGPGVYELADIAFPAAGLWTLKVGALVSDFDKRVFTTEVPIQ